MKNKILLITVLILTSLGAYAQLGVGTMTPNASAELDVVSTTRGFLPPRMTEVQRNAIVTPPNGLLVYCSNCVGGAGYYIYSNTSWNPLANTDSQTLSKNGLTVTLQNGGSFKDSILTEAQVLAFVNSNGYLTSFTEVDGSITNEIQSLSKLGQTVTLSNGGGNFTDDVLTEAEVDAFANNNGYLSSEVDGSTTNEIQSLSKSGQTVTLSNGGGNFTDDVLTEAEVDAFANNNGYLSSEVDGSITNEIQNLNLSGNNLQIDGATGVDLTPFMDNTDNQTISRSGTTVSLQNGGTFQDSVLTESQVDAFANNNGYLSSEVDGSITNEIQSLSKSGQTVTLSNGGGNFTDDVLTEAEVDAYANNNGYLSSEVDGSTTNEIQSLSKSGQTVALSNGGGNFTDDVLTEAEVDAFANNNGYLSSEVDGSITNEIQNLNLSGNNLQIDGATGVDLTPFMDNTDNQTLSKSGLTVNLQNGGSFKDSILTEAQVDAFANNNGYLSSEVDGSITNEIQNLNLSGNNLQIDGATGVDLSSFKDNTDNQTLSKTGLTVSLQNGGSFKDSILTEAQVDAFANDNGYLTSFTEVDGSITNEIQNLSLSGSNFLGITGGTGVDLSSLQALKIEGSNNIHGGTGNFPNLVPNGGTGNFALGFEALNKLTSASQNTAIGYQALPALTTGSDNTAVGRNSLQLLQTGSNNVALGNSAGFRSTGSNNVFIGYTAGPPHPPVNGTSYEALNHKLYIENTQSATPLIGGDFSLNKVAINSPIAHTASSATLTVGGDIQVQHGAKINSFSTFMSGTSDISVPTEKAVKTFVDNAIQAADGSATNEIQDLSLLGNDLSLSNDPTATPVDLSPYLDADNLGNHTASQDIVVPATAATGYARIRNQGNGEVLSLQGGGTNQGAGILLYGKDVTNQGGDIFFNLGSWASPVTDGDAIFRYQTRNGNTTTTRSVLSMDGPTSRVRIGNHPNYLSPPNETLEVMGAIRIDSGGYTNISHGATGPVPRGGSGTMVHYNNNFYGWNGTTWNAMSNTDTQDLSLSGNSLSLSNDPTATAIDLAPYLDNVDAQDLSLSGNSLSLSNDPTATAIDLAPYLDNVDAQDLSLSGNNLSLTNDPTATAIDLSVIKGLAVTAGSNLHGDNTNFSSLTGGHGNLALGNNALTGLITGSINVALGTSALPNLTNGSDNIAIGRNALNHLADGANNIAIGSSAGFNNLGSRNLFLGYIAGPSSQSTVSDKLYINYGASSSPLIGGDFALNKVGINASIGFTANSATLTVGGDIKLQNGAAVNEFSTDNTLAGNSDLAVPSEKAVKEFVENKTNYGTAKVGVWPPSNQYAMFGHKDLDHSYATAAGSEFALIQQNTGKTFLNSHNNPLHLRVDNKDFLTILQNGNVGVNTTNPTRARFEVNGTGGNFTTVTNSIYLANNSTNASGVHGPGIAWGGLSIYASNAIAGSHLIAHSDERIKSIIGVSDAKSDLETLMNIRITDYTFKDTIQKGMLLQKKVIAQQLKEVYPIAVDNSITRAVPDIYQKAEANMGWVNLATDLKKGERVQIITESSEEIFEVLEVKEGAFKIAFEGNEKVFVYGREVNDFHTVDYDAVAMLNVSATQELARKLLKSEAQVENVQQQNNELKAMLMQLNERMGAMEQQVQNKDKSILSLK